MPPRTDDTPHGTGHELDPTCGGGLAQRRRHAAAVDPRRAGRVQDAVHGAERREERAGLLGGHLDDLPRRPAQHLVGVGGEPLVLVLAQADGQDAAAAPARPGHIDAVELHPLQQSRVVRARLP